MLVNAIEALVAKPFLHSGLRNHCFTRWQHMSMLFFRLWGDHGQESLENAHVCLINATATGTEILKNLVLPGKTHVALC